MKRFSLMVCLTGATLVSSGCAEGVAYAPYPLPAYWGGPDVWYDGYYGPYPLGYWGPDMVFYFRDRTGHYVPDPAGHFRNRRFGGARGYRSRHPPR